MTDYWIAMGLTNEQAVISALFFLAMFGAMAYSIYNRRNLDTQSR
jgi:hypothetical protein